jgi:hypothetical protein
MTKADYWYAVAKACEQAGQVEPAKRARRKGHIIAFAAAKK